MKMFIEKLDEEILDNFWQPYADKINDRFGKSNFWIAQWVGTLCAVGWAVLSIYTYIFPPTTHEDLSLVILLTIIASAAYVLGAYRCRQLARKQDEFYTRRTMSPFRRFEPWGVWRLVTYQVTAFFLFFFVGSSGSPPRSWFGGILLVALIFLLPLLLGFAGCTPKPRRPLPAKAKIVAEPSSA